jgi:translocation and assembly module TamB
LSQQRQIAEPPETPEAPPPAATKRFSLRKAVLAVGLGLAAVLALLVATARYGVLSPQGRQFIEARADGLRLGSLGQLKVEGLSGDLWRDFSVRRLTIGDAGGIWLEADRLHVTWRWSELLIRRFHAQSIDAETIRLIRRPTLGPGGEGGGRPISIYLDEAHARVEMLPAFSLQRGLYDVVLNLAVRRGGSERGTLRAASLLSPGDHFNLQFDIGKSRPLLILADAAEARGGALAGALGLPANQPFLLRVAADGKTSAGRFTAVLISGATRPVEAAGAWSPQGGEARGRVSLSASSLTSRLAQRFGPEARFEGVGRKAGGDLYDLDLQASSENLRLRAQGLGDLGTRRLGPKGLDLTAESGELSRITGGPQMGAAKVTGKLSGDAKRWRFAGASAVQGLALGGYALDQASGPLELAGDPGGVTLKAKLGSRGGRGAGWTAAILGGAPQAVFEGARLSDGRLALRKLEVVGAGLRLQASGGRGLLGGLTFKGQADVSNLAAARPGAGGAARIIWSAGQGHAGDPWGLKLDVEGDRFATGYAELDRLLGAKPRFEAKADLQGRRLAVAKAELKGAALAAETTGVLAEDGKLDFKLAWSADGPFRAGPVEITGHARGGGALSGALSAPRADLTADVAEIDLPRLPLKNAHLTLGFAAKPDGSSGAIAASADSGFGPARGRADFRFPQGGVDLTSLSLDGGGLKAEGSLSLRRTAPSSADLTLAVGRGAFLEAGKIAGLVKIADAPGGPRAQLSLSADGARAPGSSTTLVAGRLTAEGPLARLPYALEAQGVSGAGKFAADGRGVLSQASPGFAATFDGSGRLGGRDLRTLETATFRFGGPERSARLKLASSDGGRISLDGRLTDQAADIRAQLAGVGLNLVDEDLAGRMDADITLQGRGGRLDGGLEARLSGARGRGAPATSGVDSVVHGRLAGPALTLDATATNGQGLTANASLTLPTEASAVPFRLAVAPRQPLHGRFSADGEVRPLWDLLVGGERSLSGRVRTQGTLEGTLAEPQAAGQVSVVGGRFDDGQTGLSLRNVAINADFAHDAVDITQATGVDGRGGTVAGAGRISLERQGVSSFRLDLHGFRLIDNEYGTASATGQATINRDANGQVKLSGVLDIDRADIAPHLPSGSNVVAMDVVEKNRPAELIAREPTATAGGAGWGLDVALRAPGRVFLKGRGLNVELSLDAHVGGTTADPTLSGAARVVRGDYDFAGKRFQFDASSIVYLATHARDIRLNLSATRDDPTLTAMVKIAGTAAKPEVTLSSSPSLPSDEVLSQVLFGASAAQLSPMQAAQLASAVSSLASGGGLDVIGNLRAFAGLDRLALGGDQATGVTVSGGKYIRENVYLELTQSAREGPAAQVEWRARRDLSIISRMGTQQGSRLAIRWRHDY